MGNNSQDNPAASPARSAGERRRFAVLCHIDSEGRHFDLLIEAGETLATWKLAQPPEAADASGTPCRRIPDHRSIYLEYEGPISGDRGEVTRRDEGDCIVHVCDPSRWDVTFRGRSLTGRFELRQSDSDAAAWLLVRL